MAASFVDANSAGISSDALWRKLCVFVSRAASPREALQKSNDQLSQFARRIDWFKSVNFSEERSESFALLLFWPGGASVWNWLIDLIFAVLHAILS